MFNYLVSVPCIAVVLPKFTRNFFLRLIRHTFCVVLSIVIGLTALNLPASATTVNNGESLVDSNMADSSGQATKVTFLFAFLKSEPRLFSSIKGIYLHNTEITAYESDGDYTKVKVDKKTGYMRTAFIGKSGSYVSDGSIKLLKSFYHIAQGDTKALTNLFSGNDLNFSSSDSSVVEIINNTYFKAKKTGSVTITASKGLQSATSRVYVFYRWKNNKSSSGFQNYDWKTTANKATAFYKGPGEGYRYDISSGKTVEVHGDIDSWALVKVANGANYNYGFVKIEDISTKNTMSFYNSLGWKWPTQDKTIHHISSPYAPRSDSTSTSIMHRGADIVNINGGTAGSYVVSPCSGTVKYIRSNTDSCGYCISIRTDDVDPVTGQRISVIFMHLRELPKDGNGNLIQLGKRVTPNSIIGIIGNTNGGTNPSMGAHLHFETNNKDAGVGDAGRSNFVNTINPLLYYLDMKNTITYNYSASMTDISTYGFYWYYYQST